MTKNDEDVSLRAIEICHGLNRKAAAQYHQRGITSADVAIDPRRRAIDAVSNVRKHLGLSIGDNRQC